MDSGGPTGVVTRRLRESALEVFRRLPLAVRRWATHRIAPTYAVGAVAVCLNADHEVLLVRSRHNPGWSLPGGLLNRGETPAEAVARELGEELELDVRVSDLDSTPRVVVDPASRQVTVVHQVSLAERPVVDGVETVELNWFTADAIPAELWRGTRESLELVGFLSR